MLDKIDRILNIFETIICGVVCIAMLVITCMIVIWRYILVSPLPWGEEAARYLMIWFVFWGCALAAKGENHLGVEAFVNMLPSKIKCTAIKIMYVLTAMIFTVLFILSCQMFSHYITAGQVSTILRIPMNVVYACVPFGLLLSVWHYVIHFIQHIHDRPAEKEAEKL
ncbi:putative transporter [Oscillibacter valericigenes Sjm18-20]|nr:putative transporter [Oscillibacter valericigenes Sjm18-20]